MRPRLLVIAVAALIVALISGCAGTSNSRLIDYRSARTAPPLEIPPDLAAATAGSRPDGSSAGTGAATYSGFSNRQGSRPVGAEQVLPQYSNVKLVREGQTRFVVAKEEPGTVWPEVRTFLTKTGLTIAREDPKAGLIETDWAENFALVGTKQDSGLGKWFRSNFSTGLRDKYRVRLERGIEPHTTEVYITHSGMEEVSLGVEGTDHKANPGWQPRPSDPELEAEMLHRLAAFLGGENTVGLTTAQAPAADSPASIPVESRPTPSARLTHDGSGAALLTLEDSLDRAWRRVGLSLDRIGFTVEDRDRSKGIYYVRYIDPDSQSGEKGFFTRLFSRSDPAPSNQYQVQVRPADNGTNVEVLDKKGEVDATKTGERILSLLYEQLK